MEIRDREGYGVDVGDHFHQGVNWPELRIVAGFSKNAVFLHPDSARELARELLRQVGEEVG